MLEGAKVVATFPKCRCCLMNFQQHIDWILSHTCWDNVEQTAYLTGIHCSSNVRVEITYLCDSKRCCSPSRLFWYLLNKTKICIRLKPEQYCTCRFSFVFIEESKCAVLLKKGLSFMFILPLQQEKEACHSQQWYNLFRWRTLWKKKI